MRSEFLLKSDLIVGAKESYNVDPLDRNKDYATFIASTDRNIYLPKDYIQSIIKGKPEYWVNRYIYASFSIAEGMVYPMFMEHVVPAFNIQDKIKNEGWETIHGVDFGILDPTVLISAAIDPNTGVVYVYDEYYKRNQSVPYHAQEMKKRLEWIPLGNIIRIMADPAGARRGQSDRRSLFDHYSEYGLYFKAGDNRIETGIAKVYAYFAAGKLKIFDTCRNLIEEGINYRYKPQELDSEKNPDERPIDKDNHGLDALRYMIQELPDDPYALKDRAYHYTQQQKKEDQLPYALQDDDYNLYDSKESWYYYY